MIFRTIFAGGLLPVADENRNGLMQATYAKTFRIGKSIIADTGNKTVKICSITGDGKGFNALCLLRSVYSAGESTLLSINAAYGGGKEYVTINAFNVSLSYKKGMFKKKSIIGGGFDLYVVLDLNVTFDIFYTSTESVPLILTESKDEGLIEI